MRKTLRSLLILVRTILTYANLGIWPKFTINIYISTLYRNCGEGWQFCDESVNI